jgi:AraC family L-rhamnose operon transcriptional activator RhaR
LDVIKCLVLPTLMDEELGWLKSDRRVGRILRPRGVRLRPTAPRTLQLGPDAFARCMDLLEPVVGRPTSPPLQNKPGLIGRLLALLEELATAWAEQFGEAPAAPATVQRAVQLLEKGMDRRWSMTELAAAAYSSPAHLSRQFSTVMGLPPMAYLARLRVERAAALLRTTDLTVKEIARRVGFRRADYFIPRFRKYFDISPGEYRRRHGTAKH